MAQTFSFRGSTYRSPRGPIGRTDSIIGVRYSSTSGSRFLQPGLSREADVAIGRANKEIGARLQEVAFRALSNRLVKSRAAGRQEVSYRRGARGQLGLRAALRDPDMSMPYRGGWQNGVAVGNEAVFQRYKARAYWRTIEGGGGPVGRLFPAYVLNRNGQGVRGKLTGDAERLQTPSSERARRLQLALGAKDPRRIKALQTEFRSEQAVLGRTLGKPSRDWRSLGGAAVFASGVIGANGRSGSKRGSVDGAQAREEERGYFRVTKPIVPVRYMAAMREAAVKWSSDGTFAGIYATELRKLGIVVTDRSALGAVPGRRQTTPDATNKAKAAGWLEAIGYEVP